MQSNMLTEALEIPAVASRVLQSDWSVVPKRPDHLYTLARGSSDHAATVIHRIMQMTGLAATTLPPSLLRSSLRLPRSTVLAISQSGASPDLHEGAQQCAARGVPVISIVNQADSPLALASSLVIEQQAGPELAVAATKSVVASILCGVCIAQRWGVKIEDPSALADQLDEIQQIQIDPLVEMLLPDSPVIVLGRGSGLGIAGEIALKIQELLRRPAFAYSSAEVLHGPAGMITDGFPVIALAVGPEADEVRQSAGRLAGMGADVKLLEHVARSDGLAATELLSWVYLGLEAACRARGLSPDKPENLHKVTLTR